MRVMRKPLLIVVSILVTGVWIVLAPAHPGATLAQTSDAGVFGLDEAYWEEQAGTVFSGGWIEFAIDGGMLLIQSQDGYTTSVTYDLDQSLTLDGAHQFAKSSLLPSDASLVGQYNDILPGSPAGAVTVLLYESSNLAMYLGSSGLILLAWEEGGARFSVSVSP